MRDFFSSHIRNPNTRRAYREAVRQFSVFCAENDIRDIAQALGHDVSHQSAHTPDRKPPQRELAETPKQEKSQGDGHWIEPLKHQEQMRTTVFVCPLFQRGHSS
jgi:hypothetical protein